MMQTESIINNNEKFWLEMTKLGTLRYCHEMLKLSIEFQSKRSIATRYDEYLESIDDKILSYMDFVSSKMGEKTWYEITGKDSPFPSDLHGYIHEWDSNSKGTFQPNHLMCKLAVLRDDDNKFSYEFLIEYDIFEMDVEIYFGVKAVADSWKTTPEFQQMVLENWRYVEKMGAYLRHKHRFKLTNNGNNGTFWPFWWRLGIDCKEELLDAVQIIKKFYNDYKKFLNLKDVVKPRFDEIAKELENSLLRDNDYDTLIETITKEFDKDVANKFIELLEISEEEGLIRKQKINGTIFICIGSVIKMVVLIRNFFMKVSWSKKEWKDKHTPIAALSKVILDKHGRVINNSNWRKDKEQCDVRYREALNKLEKWFPELSK